MNILVVNCGSSSLKYQVINMDNESLLAKGSVTRIGEVMGLVKQSAESGKLEKEVPVADHTVAVELMLDAIKSVGISLDDIQAVGHRVLHGGAELTKSMLVDEKVKDAIRACIPLGPLHNPANLMGIEVCEKLMPGKPQVAVFDTAFHQTMPEKAFMYAVPYKYYEDYKVRKYGFHGTSHRYVSARVREFVKDSATDKIIVCHLGNGSSLSAVKDGKCVDTTMGLTPLEGLVMGTRSGSLDPAVVEFICDKEGINATEMLQILNKKSGLYGICGHGDMQDVVKAANEGDHKSELARAMMIYSVQKAIGAFTAAMNGVDVIAFTAGIGENNSQIRQEICSALGYLGVKISYARNQIRGEDCVISTDDSKVKVVVIPTNEELMIARDTKALVE